MMMMLRMVGVFVKSICFPIYVGSFPVVSAVDDVVAEDDDDDDW